MKAPASILFLIFFFSSRLFSQDLKITAVYYDSDNKPYKVEQKYVDKDSSQLYVGHYNNGSNCIRIKEIKRADTTIISEEYYLFAETQTPLEKYIRKVCDVSVISDENNPGIFVSGGSYDSSLVVDSIMSLEEIKKYIEPTDIFGSLNQLHMRLLLDGKIKPDLNERILQETVTTYYLNNQLVKIEWRGKENQLYGFYVCTTKDTVMTCKGFGLGDKPLTQPTSYHTITWNKDSSKINWIIKDALLKQSFHLRYCFEGKKLKTYSKNKLVSEIDYLELNDAFSLFIKDGLEADSFCSNQLLGLEKYKYNKISESGHISTYTYTFDAAKRVNEQKQYYDGKLNARITYSYDAIAD